MNRTLQSGSEEGKSTTLQPATAAPVPNKANKVNTETSLTPTTTTVELFEEVRKSAVECNEYNTTNAAAIACGVLAAQKPDAHTLRVEAERAAAVARQQTSQLAALAILNYLYPDAAPVAHHEGARLDLPMGLTLTVMPNFVSKSYGYGSRFDSWRITMTNGGYGDNKIQKWVKLDGGQDAPVITATQADNFRKKVAVVQAEIEAKAAFANTQRTASQRKAAFRADAANAQVVNEFGLDREYVEAARCNNYRSYGTRWSVEGVNVTISGDTHTEAQWRQLAALRVSQRAQYAALKASFTATK